MKKQSLSQFFKFVLILASMSNQPTFSQGIDDDKNYILNFSPNIEETETSVVETSSVIDVAKNKTYFDGFGQTIQNIGIQQSPGLKDIIQPFGNLDGIGRPIKNYLPFAATTSNGGFFVSNATDASKWTQHYGTAEDDYAFGVTIYDDSPLGRIRKQGFPGSAWQPNSDIQAEDNAILLEYTFGSYIFKWEISTGETPILSPDHYYGANEFNVFIKKDENWTSSDGNNGTVKVYTNKSGQVILTRTYNSNEISDTYQVYDNYGNLRFIIPPEAIQYVTDEEITNIPDNRIFKENTNITGIYSQDYYYMPDVIVTLQDGFDGQNNFSISAYPMNIELIEKYLYINEYDSYDRVIRQKSPGAEWIYTIYDKRGRLVMSQDGLQRKTNEWTFTKYDIFDRPILTGFLTDSRDQTTIQNEVNSQVGGTKTWYETRGTTIHGYTNTSYPNISNEDNYLLVSYYDNYDFAASWGNEFTFNNSNGINNGPNITIPKGQVTGGKIRILGETTWLRSVIYYDYYYRPIQSFTEHYNNRNTKNFTAYNYPGDVLVSQSENDIGLTNPVILKERYDYDNAGRVVKVYHKADDNPEVLLTKYEYNELGQMVDKKLHSEDDGTNFIQSVDFRYNIRGWPISINNSLRSNDGTLNDDVNDIFGMQLDYNSNQLGLNPTPQYNGNISAIAWSNSNMSSNNRRSYSYSYDKLNSYISSTYKENSGGGWTAKNNYYDENNISYDKNGNIKTLKRKANNTLIDDLTYTYANSGNLITSINDAQTNDNGFKDGAELSDEYGYDENGNLIYDKNKNITSITYNRLNLPELITFGNGKKIEFVYDAGGTKLKQTLLDGTTELKNTEYVSGMIFEDSELKIISIPEGRLVVDRVSDEFAYDYQYFIADYLGNVRAMCARQTKVYTATMESELAATEEGIFENVALTRSSLMNHTPPGVVANPNESSMLNATLQNPDGTRRMVGPSQALKVYPGDTVKMEVYARYNSTCGNNETNVGTFLFSALTSGFGLTVGGETGIIYDAFNDAFGAVGLINQNPCDVPKAYLNYILFSNDFSDYDVGFAQVTASAETNWIKLSLSAVVNDEGYFYSYVSNESTLNVNIYFDDFKVTHISSMPLLQANDYYAFGLPITDYEIIKDEVKSNRFLFQSKEWMEDEGLNLYDFGARMYDPATGRFWVLDPKGQFAAPYMGMGNNPVISADPDGQWVQMVIGAVVGAWQGGTIANGTPNPLKWDYHSGKTWGYMAAGAAIGAVSGGVGGQIAASGMPFATTASIATSSTYYSVGMSCLSGGSTPTITSFGVVSYDWTNNEFGYLGKRGNSDIENVGYGFGALANLQDIVTGFWPDNYQFQYELNKSRSKVGHGNVRHVTIDANGNITNEVKISVANNDPIDTNDHGLLGAIEYAWKANFNKYSGGPLYWTDVPEKGWPRIPLKLNYKIVDWMANNLHQGEGLWGISRTRFGINFGCASYAARSLWTAGVPTIPIINYLGPRILWTQLAIRQVGIYSSPYLQNF